MVVAVSPLMAMNIFASNVFADNNGHTHTLGGEESHQYTVFHNILCIAALAQML